METMKVFLSETLIEYGVHEAVAAILVGMLAVLILLLTGIILNFIVKKAIMRMIKFGDENQRKLTIGRLLNSISRYVIWFIVVLIALKEIGVDVTPIIASAGVVGLAVGFGAQAIVKDFISGFFLMFEGTFDVGDLVQIDGFTGNVVSLGLRTTVLQNWKNEVKTVSNGDITSVINYSKNDSVAVVEFGVSYDTDLSKFNNLMESFVEKTFERYDNIIETPNFLGVTNLADSSINMLLIAKTKTLQHFGVERELRKDLVKYCEDNGIEIPFPQVVVRNV